jgi:hypothetical protein
MYAKFKGASLPWKYGSWIYSYICNQYLSPLMLWVRISIRAWCKTLCDKNCQWHATSRWLSSGHLLSSTNITECHNINEVFLKVALNTIKQINKRHLKFGHPSRSLSKIKYINICNGPPIWHQVEHFYQIGWKLKRLKSWNIPFLAPFMSKQ